MDVHLHLFSKFIMDFQFHCSLPFPPSMGRKLLVTIVESLPSNDNVQCTQQNEISCDLLCNLMENDSKLPLC